MKEKLYRLLEEWEKELKEIDDDTLDEVDCCSNTSYCMLSDKIDQLKQLLEE